MLIGIVFLRLWNIKWFVNELLVCNKDVESYESYNNEIDGEEKMFVDGHSVSSGMQVFRHFFYRRNVRQWVKIVQTLYHNYMLSNYD